MAREAAHDLRPAVAAAGNRRQLERGGRRAGALAGARSRQGLVAWREVWRSAPLGLGAPLTSRGGGRSRGGWARWGCLKGNLKCFSLGLVTNQQHHSFVGSAGAL